MRVIGGEFKGKFLCLPKVEMRATSQKVKKALFDLLGKRIMQSAFLDLFSGSGQVGIEAISRGANSVVFSERDPICLKALERNLGICQGKHCQLFAGDAFKTIKELAKKKMQFEIIFADPPYTGFSAKKCLREIYKYGILKNPGIVVIEHHKNLSFADFKEKLLLARRYGDSVLSFFGD
jgi:16S rRNA (guanine(966)-N(2))-methyltransferase RsmD